MNTQIAIAALLAFQVAGPAFAHVVELQDGNSSAFFEINSALGQFIWEVEDSNQLSRQGFWYRVGSIGGESPLGTLNRRDFLEQGNNFSLDYVHQKFTAHLEVILTGGATGSQRSRLVHTLTVTNTTTTPLELHLFQYADFDVGGVFSANTLTIADHTVALQTGGGDWTVSSLASPAPDHVQAALFPKLLDSLSNSTPTELNDVAGPLSGDLTFGFQWDLTIPASQGVAIAITQDVMPEASTCAALMLGFVLTTVRRRSTVLRIKEKKT